MTYLNDTTGSTGGNMQRFNELLDLLKELSTKSPGEKVDPEILGDSDVSISIVMIGRRKALDGGGWPVYVTYIEKAMKRGMKTFWLMARGYVNTRIAEVVATSAVANTSLTNIGAIRSNVQERSAWVPELLICLEIPPVVANHDLPRDSVHMGGLP